MNIDDDDRLTPTERREERERVRAARRAEWIAQCRAAIAAGRARQPRTDDDAVDDPVVVPGTPTGDRSLDGSVERVESGIPDVDHDHRT